jgi:hypothetical protein
MQVVLVMFRPDGQRRSFSVTREVTVIGRREDCDLRIPLGEVSRKHCRLVKDGDALRFEDLGSSNGTFHNGTRVREAELQPGDVLTVGPVSFTIQINGVPADDQLQPATGDAASTFSAVPADYVSQGVDGNDRLGEMASVITDVQEPGPAGHASDDVEALQASDGEEAAEELAELEPVEEATEEAAELEPVEESAEEVAELEPVEEESEELVELESVESTEGEAAEELAELEPIEEATEAAPETAVEAEADSDSETIDEAPIAIEHEDDSVISAQEMTDSEEPHTAIDPSQHVDAEDLVDMDLHDSR